ncbi:hypothetical protein RINTHM_14920 [Richelia intracellularis HM01]|nr:hypothetical protein RINTHM_14920 [Richelia intracellularis HM01]
MVLPSLSGMKGIATAATKGKVIMAVSQGKSRELITENSC